MKKNDLFNVNLFQLLTKEPTYTKFNQYIYKSAVMADITTKQEKNSGSITADTSYSLSFKLVYSNFVI